MGTSFSFGADRTAKKNQVVCIFLFLQKSSSLFLSWHLCCPATQPRSNILNLANNTEMNWSTEETSDDALSFRVLFSYKIGYLRSRSSHIGIDLFCSWSSHCWNTVFVGSTVASMFPLMFLGCKVATKLFLTALDRNFEKAVTEELDKKGVHYISKSMKHFFLNKDASS